MSKPPGFATTLKFLEISKHNFTPIPVLASQSKVMAKFDNIAMLFYDKIVVSEQISYSLTALRDTLLPKLVSGDVEVKGVGSVT